MKATPDQVGRRAPRWLPSQPNATREHGLALKAAKSLAASLLPQPPAADGRYGVGFLGVHDGRDANLVFVDWWADENELHHHVFLSPSDAPTQLRPAEPGELTACVWDLAVIGFERDAWVESVLRHSGVPNLDGYLAMQLSGEA